MKCSAAQAEMNSQTTAQYCRDEKKYTGRTELDLPVLFCTVTLLILRYACASFVTCNRHNSPTFFDQKPRRPLSILRT